MMTQILAIHKRLLQATEAVHHRYIFDEVHKYQGWNQELKNIYDSFPEVSVVFSGSSSIDLVKSSYDLSRRAVLFRLRGYKKKDGET